jgi:hypothetical protein
MLQRSPLRTPFLFLTAAAVMFCAACGSSGNDAPAPPAGGINNGGSSAPTCTPGPLSPFNAPTAVTISGANAAGVDINVGGPQSCPPPNGQVLGIADLGASSITATNIGAQVRRGDIKTVILFGPGLGAATNVDITGQPGDFLITDVVNRNATDGTPGVQFQITVSPAAAFGARTVVLRSANGDATAFTGGLEVIR